MIKFYITSILAALMSVSCGESSKDFDPKKYLLSEPNAAMELYIQKHPNFCRRNLSKKQVWNSVKHIKNDNNRKAEYLLRLGFCYAMNGDKDMAALYMYRVAALNDLVETDEAAYGIALSFMQGKATAASTVDFGWSNKTMLDNKITSYSPLSNFPPESNQGKALLKGSQSRNRMALKVFDSEFESSRGD